MIPFSVDTSWGPYLYKGAEEAAMSPIIQKRTGTGSYIFKMYISEWKWKF